MATQLNGVQVHEIDDSGDVPFLKSKTTRELGEVRPRVGRLDDVARVALMQTSKFKTFKNKGDQADTLIRSKGLSDEVATLTARINRGGLPTLSRVLLSQRDIYGYLLLRAFNPPSSGGSSSGGSSGGSSSSKSSGAQKSSSSSSSSSSGRANSGSSSARTRGLGLKPDDRQGIYDAVVRGVDELPRNVFEGDLVKEVMRRNDIEVDWDGQNRPEDRRKYLRILERVHDAAIPLDMGVAEQRIVQIHRETAAPGRIPSLVAEFADKIEPHPPTEVQDRMVAELQALNVDFESPAYDKARQLIQPYLPIAYSHATKTGGGDESDPVTLTSPTSTVTPWDFEVETFEEAEAQGVVPENIRAAGALDYVYYLGEALGVYKLTDALVLRWASGLVDIESPETTSRLYRYWQLRDDRLSPEDKGMLYKRVLNKGDQELLSRMVVNESFPNLWHKLMSLVAEYIQVATEASGESTVSRVPIERATQELQSNLSEHMVGMGQMQVTDMYMQLRDAFEILGDQEIVDQLSAGRRRNMWAVIERLSKEEFGTAPDVGALRTLAVQGNQVFQWIAEFDRGAYTDDQFERFRDAAEAWIIAAASGAEERMDGGGDSEYEDDEEFDEFGEEPEDSDEDW